MANFVVGELKTAHALYTAVDGRPAEVQGDVKWSVKPEAAAAAIQLVPGGERLDIGVQIVGAFDGWQVVATADADLRDGAEFVRDLAIESEMNTSTAPEAVGGAVTLN